MANFTAQAIKASFMKLLNERPLNKISVKDIVEDCGINRNSFYYHFQDIPSLVTEIVTEQTDKLIQKYPSISSLDECFRIAGQYALENRRAVMHIYNSVNRDVFVQNAMRLCEDVVTKYIETAFPENSLEPEDRKVVIHFVKCGLFGICTDWLDSGLNDGNFEELLRLMELCKGSSELIIQQVRRSKQGNP